MNILLVDDSELAREPLELQLRLLGHSVQTAGNGEDALSKIMAAPFDLVITDIRMPVMNGLELLGHAKALHPDQDIIMVTGHGDMDSSLVALRHGAGNYLMKPVNLEELTIAVKAVEGRRAMVQKLAEQEKKLAQARKMADLGFVAGGVAHEINNPNTFIRGNVQTLNKFWRIIDGYVRDAISEGVQPPPLMGFILEETPRILDATLNGTNRIKDIVDNMAALQCVREKDTPDFMDINGCARNALAGIEMNHDHICFLTDLDHKLPPVPGDEQQITEAVRELIANSVAAVGGRENPVIRIESYLSAGNMAQLAVEDNGRGIRPENHDQVFTPFFSTDPRIGRPGLGLSKAYAIIMNHGGHMTFTSEPDVGTRFSFAIPVS